MTRDPNLAAATGRRRTAAVAGHRRDADTARQYLDDPVGDVRATALGALLRAGALTPDDLAVAVVDDDPVVRIRAAELIADLGGGGPATTVALVPLLDDPDPAVVEVDVYKRQPGTSARTPAPPHRPARPRASTARPP